MKIALAFLLSVACLFLGFLSSPAQASPTSRIEKFVMVVPVYRELYNQNIATLLLALAKQDLSGLPFEKVDVWLSVNNSTDANADVRTENQETVEYLRAISQGRMPHTHPSHQLLRDVAKQNLSRVLNLHVLDHTTPGYSSRNIGLVRDQATRTAIRGLSVDDLDKTLIAHMDADSSFEPNYVRSIVKAFEARKLKFALLNMLYTDQSDSDPRVYQRKILSDYQIAAYDFRMASDGGMPAGGTPRIVTTAETFLEAGGMPHEIVGEDTTLIANLRSKFSSEGLFLDIPVYAKFRARDDGYDAAIYLRDLDKPVIFGDWHLATKPLFNEFEAWLRKMPLVHKLYEEALEQNLQDYVTGVRFLKARVVRMILQAAWNDHAKSASHDVSERSPALIDNAWFRDLLKQHVRDHGADIEKILSHLEQQFPFYFREPLPKEIVDIAHYRAVTQAFLNLPFLKEDSTNSRATYLSVVRERYPQTAALLEMNLSGPEREIACASLFH